MPPKKKQLAPEEEDLTYKIFPLYKRKCDQMGIYIHFPLKNLLENAVEKGGFTQFQVKEDLGPLQVRALFEAMSEIKYSKFKNVEFWKADIKDEGLRNICRYLDSVKDNILQKLDILQNGISPLGCEFLGKSLMNPNLKIQYLKLDNNNIGTEGLKRLAVGLRTNPSITKLSLKNCGIDSKGAIFIQEILANISSKIRSLKLQGNNLENQGLYYILRAVDINEVLQKINIADTGLNLLAFKARHMVMIQKKEQAQYIQESYSSQKQQIPDNPEGDINNVKETIPIGDEKKQMRPGTTSEKEIANDSDKQEQQADPEEQKITRIIGDDDDSLQASIMRLLTSMMKNSLIIKKYDLRFNPISDDAAHIIFEIIEENGAIKDVELNNNVDANLRENLDTLMRKRTGRMPKGRAGGVGKKKKKKK